MDQLTSGNQNQNGQCVELQPPNEDDPEVRKEVTVNAIGIKKT